MKKQPEGFNALMQLLDEAGFRTKRGKQISILPPGGKRYIRMDTLGDAYSESALRSTLAGGRVHKPRRYRVAPQRIGVGLLIDIEKKLQEGKGKGYQVWAARNNTKTLAKSMVYIKEHGLENYAALETMIREMSDRQKSLKKQIAETDFRLTELSETRKVITTYRRTRDLYVQYHDSGWSRKFYLEHQAELDAHLKAKRAYDAVQGKMPLLKDISAEYEQLLKEKREAREAYRTLQTELREALNVKANIEEITRMERKESENEKQDRRNRT